MSDFPEAWNHPHAALGATRKGDGWTLTLPWEPDPVVSFALAAPLVLVLGVGAWRVGVASWSGPAIAGAALGGLVVLIVGVGSLMSVLGKQLGTTIELQPTGMRIGKVWYERHALPQVQVDHDVDAIRDPSTTDTNRLRETRVEVLVLDGTRERVDLPSGALHWLVGAVEHLRTEADAGRLEQKEALHDALDGVRGRARELER